jgi:hypothetical protein
VVETLIVRWRAELEAGALKERAQRERLAEQTGEAVELERRIVELLQVADQAAKDKTEKHVNLQAQVDRLKTEQNKCLDLIVALRRQIKETRDAMELDNPKLQDLMAKVQAETADRQGKLEARVKVAAAAPGDAKGGWGKLGAGVPPRGGALPVPAASYDQPGLEYAATDVDGDGMLSKEELQRQLRSMGWSLEEAEKTFKAMDRDGDVGIFSNEYAAFCSMEDKNLEFGTLAGMAKLRETLNNLQTQLAEVLHEQARDGARERTLHDQLEAAQRGSINLAAAFDGSQDEWTAPYHCKKHNIYAIVPRV